MATILQKELRNNVGEVLRRAPAGEQITIMVSGRATRADPKPSSAARRRPRGARMGCLQAAIANRASQQRRRSADLAIAATAKVHGAVLLTHNLKDFAIMDDLGDA